MLDFFQERLSRIGLCLGILFAGSAALIGGLKFYEHMSYVATTAKVVSVSVKCEMSYKTGRRSTNERIAECGEVESIKRRYPEVDWSVDHVTFVAVEYAVDSGLRMTTTVRLGKLERAEATVGETIQILRSRETPDLITGPVSLHFLKYWIPMFLLGVGLLGTWWVVRRWRARTQLAGLASLQHELNTLESQATKPSNLPLAQSARSAAREGSFGRRPSPLGSSR
jgi:hypothetical protein